MNDDFGENPFRQFKLPIQKDDTEGGIDPRERALFIDAYAKLGNLRTETKRGFKLADQCVLPVLASMKKKQTKSVSPKPPAIPKPVIPDEFALAMRDVQPISSKGRAIARRPDLKPAPSVDSDPLTDLMTGKLEFAISGSEEYIEGHVVGMDELIMNRLREGQFSPEAHYDLHGLNSVQAFESLKEFIHSAWLKDLRSVLIVTGRGKNSPAGQSILRHKIQGWLTRDPFKRVILAFCTAKPHDGGPGSIYVLLRRFRKKGPILWQRQFIEGDLD